MDSEAIERGARTYLQRRSKDRRKLAKDFRNAAVFLVLDDDEVVPLAWAITALDENWEAKTRSRTTGSARRLAERAGLECIEFEHPDHTSFWELSRHRCEQLTKDLKVKQMGFSKRGQKPRRQEHNSYYRIEIGFSGALSAKEAANDPDFEGAARQVTSNRYERKKSLRDACIRHAKKSHNGHLFCCVCKFDFSRSFGEIGHDFIHIHHKNPLGNQQKEHLVDPIKDLVPVCPNCHAMIHRGGQNRSISKIRELLASNSKQKT